MTRTSETWVGLAILFGTGCSLQPEAFDGFGPAASATDGSANEDADDGEGSSAAADSEGGSSGGPAGSEGESTGAAGEPEPEPEPEPGTTGGPASSCGNGALDEGESCDDGNDDDDDDCPSTCVPAFCGDGFSIAGVEECDDGNVLAGDGCSHHCAVELSPPKRVFITSSMITGSMGGLTGADLVCQSLAEGADLEGTFLAWLSDGALAPAFRFTHADVPYILVDGTPIAEDWADLVDGTLLHAIDLTQSGGAPPTGTHTCGTTSVWSNVTSDGGNASSSSHCAGWTDANAIESHSGRYDLAGADWSASCFGGGATCLWGAPIYCFEQ